MKGPYQFLYSSTPQSIVVESDVSTSSPNSCLSLKEVFNWVHSGARLIAGVDITVKLLEMTTFNKTNFITGRNLLDRAKPTLRNVKKALSILIEKTKDGLPSGTSLEDVYKDVLDEMYVLLKGKSNSFLSEEGEDSENEEVSGSKKEHTDVRNGGRPNDWFFSGWFTLLLFGPTSPRGNQINILSLSDPPKD